MADEPTTAEPATPDAIHATDDDQPAPPRRRRRAAAPAGEPTLAMDATLSDPPGVSTAVDPAGSPEATADVSADLGATVEAEPLTSTPAEPAPMSLLFQTPEPTAPTRRRRATSAAGPAQPAMFSPPIEAEVAVAAPRTRRRTSSRTALTPVDGEDVQGLLDDVVAAPAVAGPPRSSGIAFAAPVVEDSDDDDDEDDDLDAGALDLDPLDLDATGDDTADDDGADGADNDGADDEGGDDDGVRRRRRRRGGRGRKRRRDADEPAAETDPAVGDLVADFDAALGTERDADEDDEGDDPDDAEDGEDSDEAGVSRSARRRRRRRRRTGGDDDAALSPDDPPGTIVKVREVRTSNDDVTAVRGSTRLEAKRQRRREGRDTMRRRTVITEAEFLARRESVDRTLLVRDTADRTQIAVLEDGILVEHYVTRAAHQSMIGNVHLGKVQNVLPSMEAAFVDIGRGRNAVLYAGEVNWDAFGLEGKADRRIETALKPGDSVLVQVTKDPVGHKGARLTSQISMPGRYLVYVPGGSMTGISRKLPDTERTRLKRVLKRVLPEDSGVIVRTAAEGAAEEDLERDVARLTAQWADIQRKSTSVASPALLYSEPDLAIRVVRDAFNEDFSSLVVSGDDLWDTLDAYVAHVAPDLAPRMSRWQPAPGADADLFSAHRIDEQIAKALDRKVYLPSGGSLVIDRTEAMTVVDVNTGKYTGSGGDLEETVTRNNLEAAEEIVRQLRLRDVGGIIVIDFIDMVLESNRQLVLRRLVECLGRDRTKHQVAEVTSLGLVQMTRKRVGQGLLEAFSTTCESCHGRGVVLHDHPVEASRDEDSRDSRPQDDHARYRRGKRVDQPA